ncbi:MAG: hypothetical protein WDN69_15515 [Aliidongia sp.]
MNSFITNGVVGWNLGNLQAGSNYRGPATAFPNGVPNGFNVFNIGAGSISQQLVATVQPNTTYTVQVYVGARADFAFGGYVVSLRANSTTLASDNGTQVPSPGTFALATVNYYASASDPNVGQPLTIVLGGTGTGQANFDEVTLTATSGNTTGGS